MFVAYTMSPTVHVIVAVVTTLIIGYIAYRFIRWLPSGEDGMYGPYPPRKVIVVGYEPPTPAAPVPTAPVPDITRVMVNPSEAPTQVMQDTYEKERNDWYFGTA